LVRADFIGGWKEDRQNKFTAEGRSQQENEIHDWTMKLANFRKGSMAIKAGKMMQYVPDGGLYVYFRYDPRQTVMCVMNCDKTDRQVNFSRYSERINGFTRARSVINAEVHLLSKEAMIPANSTWVLELLK
jgi:hypothetical protein